jgi:hypothetical protein
MKVAATLLLAAMACMPAASQAAAANPFCAGLIAAVDAQQLGGAAGFVRSYQPGANETNLPAGLITTAFVYDNAAAAIALVACGDVAKAVSIGDALDKAVSRDRSFNDGRVRNAYRAGAVITDSPNLPGWWDHDKNLWGEDAAQDGTSTGNVAWAALALLTLHEATGQDRYLNDAEKLVGWIIANTACGDAGFCGGFHGYDPQQVRLTWSSTEHNADVAAAATWLFRLTKNPIYSDAAARATAFLNRTFVNDHFLLGTKPDGSLADESMLALDVQLWPWMAVPDAPAAWHRALTFATTHLSVDGGYDFNGDRDGVWVEGTAQAALAHRMLGLHTEANSLLNGLLADRTPSGLLNATRADQLTTGLSIDPTRTVADFFYFKRPHLGATAWAALAETGWNPFTGRKVP